MFHSDLTPFGVEMKRLEKDRLARLQSAMKRDGLGALLLTDFINIRYATNTVMMLGLRATGIQRFALIPAQGDRSSASASWRAEAITAACVSTPTCLPCAPRSRPMTSSIKPSWD